MQWFVHALVLPPLSHSDISFLCALSYAILFSLTDICLVLRIWPVIMVVSRFRLYFLIPLLCVVQLQVSII